MKAFNYNSACNKEYGIGLGQGRQGQGRFLVAVDQGIGGVLPSTKRYASYLAGIRQGAARARNGIYVKQRCGGGWWIWGKFLVAACLSRDLLAYPGITGRFTNYSFRHRKDLSGLQCVDCLAWTCYRYGIYEFLGTPLHPFAKLAWDDFKRHGGTGRWAGPEEWLAALVLKKERMRDWISKEIADGTSLKQWQRWAEEDATKIGKIKFPPRKAGV